MARGMGLGVGDTLTVNLLGRDIKATIANLRGSTGSGSASTLSMVFAPGTLEDAPQTHLAAVYCPRRDEENDGPRGDAALCQRSAIHVRGRWPRSTGSSG